MRYTAYLAVIAGLLCMPLASHAETEAANGKIEGDVDLAYRTVSVDGSERKYDEDFDGMESGLFLDNLSVNWQNEGDGWLDYARVGAIGLGGEPYEQAGLRLGKKDSWELRFDSTKQDYKYDLFELVPDEDGSFWDSQRRRTNLSLDIHASDKVTVVVEYRNNQRSGDSLFLKDISRDVFRLESPLDVETDRYIIGADARLGRLNIVFRHELSSYENNNLQMTEGNLGIDTGDSTQLNRYDWVQRDDVDTDWTTLILNAKAGDRADFTLSVVGTLLGDTELTSDVRVEQFGVDFNGNEFGGTCALSPTTACNSDATCAALNAGDVCVASVGISNAAQKGDTQIVDFGTSIRIIDSLTAHLSYQNYSRDLAGTLDRDLDGDGTFEDLDGDSTPGSVTSIDHEIDTITAVLEYQPIRSVGFRGGIRSIDRSLTRSGFGDTRDTDFTSDGDETFIFGVNARPTRWLRLNADYEDGEIDQAFTNVSYVMREQTRVRALVLPTQKTRLNVTFRDWETENISPNFRPSPAIDNFSVVDGQTWSADWSQTVGESFNYFLRYAVQEVEGVTEIQFDTAGFGAIAPGFSSFLNDNDQIQGRLDFRRGSWRAYLMGSMVDTDGVNAILDTTVPTTPSFVSLIPLVQSYDDMEVGLDYLFGSGLRVGGAYRDFDYDDVNDLLDYEGNHLILRAGLSF